MKTSHTVSAARQLLHVVMLTMRTVSADMRRYRHSIAPGQLSSLMKISAGPCTMGELARHLAVSLPTVSKSIDMLVRRGWVERLVNRADRRRTMLRLTGKGNQVLTEIKRATERHM